MASKSHNIYQFKITLEGIKPTIWRRIQVPETYTFWDLHVAIKDAMGWLDCHLHQFDIINPKTGRKDVIGIPDEYDDDLNTLPGWKTSISSYFSISNKKADYEYDFGDCWRHKISLEKILTLESNIKYPLCIAGERACHPEDCGGIWGYENLLEILKDPNHEDYEERLEWLGDNFDPEDFNSADVHFDNPKERWEIAFEE